MQRPHPFDLLSFARGHFALPRAADVERHQKVKGLVGVAGEIERRNAGQANINPEFFFQFASQRRFWRFTGFNLAAWKLPQSRHGFAARALGNEHAIVSVDECDSGDEDAAASSAASCAALQKIRRLFEACDAALDQMLACGQPIANIQNINRELRPQ